MNKSLEEVQEIIDSSENHNPAFAPAKKLDRCPFHTTSDEVVTLQHHDLYDLWEDYSAALARQIKHDRISEVVLSKIDATIGNDLGMAVLKELLSSVDALGSKDEAYKMIAKSLLGGNSSFGRNGIAQSITFGLNNERLTKSAMAVPYFEEAEIQCLAIDTLAPALFVVARKVRQGAIKAGYIADDFKFNRFLDENGQMQQTGILSKMILRHFAVEG